MSRRGWAQPYHAGPYTAVWFGCAGIFEPKNPPRRVYDDSRVRGIHTRILDVAEGNISRLAVQGAEMAAGNRAGHFEKQRDARHAAPNRCRCTRNALREAQPGEDRVHRGEPFLVRLCIGEINPAGNAADMAANDLPVGHRFDAGRVVLVDRRGVPARDVRSLAPL